METQQLDDTAISFDNFVYQLCDELEKFRKQSDKKTKLLEKALVDIETKTADLNNAKARIKMLESALAHSERMRSEPALESLRQLGAAE